MKKVMLKTTISLAVALASTQIFASGFALNEQSISGMGTGYAGRSSSAEDASTVLATLPVWPASKASKSPAVSQRSTPRPISAIPVRSSGTNKGDMVPFTSVPMGFYTNKLNDEWAVGFGVYAPFGLITNYENGFQGRAFGSKSEVKVVTLQPTVSYAFNDKVSIGFGPTINRITGTLESDIALPVPRSGDNNVRSRATIQPGLERRHPGASHRHHSRGPDLPLESDYKLEGHTDVNGWRWRATSAAQIQPLRRLAEDRNT
jgi:long-chain fatty acid transport protein